MNHVEYSQLTLSLNYARALMLAVGRCGVAAPVLLKHAGLSPDLMQCEANRLTPEQVGRLMRAGWELTDDEWLGLGASACRHGVFTLMAREAVRCQTLREVYQHLARFYSLVDDSFALRLKESETHAELSLELRRPDRDPDHLLEEFLMLLWVRFPSWLIGRALPLERIDLSFETPDHVDDYPQLFSCPVRFGQPRSRLIMERAILDAPVVQRLYTLKRHLRRAPLDWFSPQVFSSVYTRRIHDFLAHRHDIGDLGMGEVADHLHMTERTLRRKLAQEQTSFQRLKDNIRREQAIHLLSQPSLSVAEISQQLGFSEPTAFTRAFRQWTGYPPRAFRSQIGGGQQRTG